MIKMDKVSVLFCSLYVLVLTPYSMAMTADQKDMVNHHLHEISKKCMKDNPITVEDMTAFKSEKMPTGPNVACFLACTYKSSGVMDSNGMLKEETMREMSKSVLHDPEELKHMEGFLRSCSHINSEAVSDGEKGCERAILAHKCMLAYLAQFGLALSNKQ